METVNDYWLKHTPLFPLEIHNSGVSLSALTQQDLTWGKNTTINKNAQQCMQFLRQFKKFGLSQALPVQF